jgi:hypothetical protein
VALGRDDENGVERYNRLNRTQYRANVTAAPSPAVEVASSVSYTTGRTYLPIESGGGGATWATFFSSPSFLYRNNQPGNPQLGFRSGPPDIYYAAYDNYQDATRFTGALTLTNRPASWFDHRLIAGVDRALEDNQSRTPRNDPLAAQYPAFAGTEGPNVGALRVGTRDVNTVSVDYAGNLKYGIGRGCAASRRPAGSSTGGASSCGRRRATASRPPASSRSRRRRSRARGSTTCSTTTRSAASCSSRSSGTTASSSPRPSGRTTTRRSAPTTRPSATPSSP